MQARNAVRAVFILPMLGMVAGCAKKPEAQVHDQSAVAHEQAAEAEEQAAEAEEAMYDPTASRLVQQKWPECNAGQNVCWSDRVNPTEEHLKRADELRDLAAKHRAAAEELKEVEAEQCAGIDPRDRDMSPFSHVEDIRSVEPAHEVLGPVKSQTTRLVGAEITFAAVPGLTQQWFQRLVDCHIARAGVEGTGLADASTCPLTVEGAQAEVTSTQDGFKVRVTGPDLASAEEILRRARALQPR